MVATAVTSTMNPWRNQHQRHHQQQQLQWQCLNQKTSARFVWWHHTKATRWCYAHTRLSAKGVTRLWLMQLINGDNIPWLLSMQMDAILSICCNTGSNMSSVEWLNILWFALITYYNNAGVYYLTYSIKNCYETDLSWYPVLSKF